MSSSDSDSPSQTELGEAVASELRDLQLQKQQAEMQLNTYARAVIQAHGYDPNRAELNLSEGIIYEVPRVSQEENGAPEAKEAAIPNE